MRSAIFSHWPLGVIAALGFVLIFTNLGAAYLWEDEGDTAVLAASIVKSGLPKAWDGTTFSDSDRGARVNTSMVMVSHPWAQYYAAAASMAVFGHTVFAARLPFAIAGWMTLLAVYALVWAAARDKLAAFCASALLLCSVQFLLYCRQSRYYALTMLLTCLVAWLFVRMTSARGAIAFAAAAVVLFHTHPLAVVPVAVLGAMTLFFPSFKPQRRWFWGAAPIMLGLTAPWFTLASAGYGEGAQPAENAMQFAARAAQFIFEAGSVTPLIGIGVLALIVVWRKQLDSTSTALGIATAASVLAYALVLGAMQSTNALWFHGMRYAAGLLPLAAIVAGILIAKVSAGRAVVWIPLLLLFAFTKLPLITPWLSWRPDGALPFGNYVVAAHLPETPVARVLGAGHGAFVRELRAGSGPGTVHAISDVLQTYSNSGDRVIANYEWEPLYFHTGLAQSLKILPGYSIANAARRAGLPDYVFDVDHARWVVWRPYWEGYLDYSWPDVAAAIASHGGELVTVAEVAETVWENREDIHFHRFANGEYLFGSPAKTITGTTPEIQAARVFRVDYRQ